MLKYGAEILLLFALWQPSSGLHFTFLCFHKIITHRAGTSLSKCPHNHMWNTLVCVHVCVCAQVRQSQGRGAGERERGEENLGQTWSEPHLKRWRKCVQPVRNQCEGSGECSQPMRRRLGSRRVDIWKCVSYIMKPLPARRLSRLYNDRLQPCWCWWLPGAGRENVQRAQ